MLTSLVTTMLAWSHSLGYGGIVLLMAIESSFIPFPSEIIIPPAAYLAYQGHMNIYLVILCGIAGSLIGALINYYLAYFLGRAIIYKIADHKISNVLLISSKKVEKAEQYFLKYGNISTFIGRLIFAVRQLISLPAGFSKMKLRNFVFFTFLGSGIWVVILALIGYYFGAYQDEFFQYYKEISILFIVVIGFVLIYGSYKKKQNSFWNKIKRLFTK